MALTKTGKVNNNCLKILKILKSNEGGLKAQIIQNLAIMPKRTLYNNLNLLKDKGLIDGIDGVWMIASNQASSVKVAQLLISNKPIQSHKFSFVLRLLKVPDWWKDRDNKLINFKDFKYGKKTMWHRTVYTTIIKDNFYIQLFSNSIVFINRKQYWGYDAYDCFLESLEDTLQIYQLLESKFKFKFYENNAPQFSLKSAHFVKTKDEIANRCKKSGRWLQVEINGQIRALVDASKPNGLETVDKDFGVEDNKEYARVVSDIIDKKPLLQSEQDELIKINKLKIDDADNKLNKLIQVTENITNNQIYYSENMVSHVKAVQDLGNGVNYLVDTIKELKQEIINLKEAKDVSSSNKKEQEN